MSAIIVERRGQRVLSGEPCSFQQLADPFEAFPGLAEGKPALMRSIGVHRGDPITQSQERIFNGVINSFTPDSGKPFATHVTEWHAFQIEKLRQVKDMMGLIPADRETLYGNEVQASLIDMLKAGAAESEKEGVDLSGVDFTSLARRVTDTALAVKASMEIPLNAYLDAQKPQATSNQTDRINWPELGERLATLFMPTGLELVPEYVAGRRTAEPRNEPSLQIDQASPIVTRGLSDTLSKGSGKVALVLNTVAAIGNALSLYGIVSEIGNTPQGGTKLTDLLASNRIVTGAAGFALLNSFQYLLLYHWSETRGQNARQRVDTWSEALVVTLGSASYLTDAYFTFKALRVPQLVMEGKYAEATLMSFLGIVAVTSDLWTLWAFEASKAWKDSRSGGGGNAESSGGGAAQRQQLGS